MISVEISGMFCVVGLLVHSSIINISLLAA